MSEIYVPAVLATVCTHTHPKLLLLNPLATGSATWATTWATIWATTICYMKLPQNSIQPLPLISILQVNCCYLGLLSI